MGCSVVISAIVCINQGLGIAPDPNLDAYRINAKIAYYIRHTAYTTALVGKVFEMAEMGEIIEASVRRSGARSGVTSPAAFTSPTLCASSLPCPSPPGLPVCHDA